MTKTKEKYADGSYKYIHNCVSCPTGTYIRPRGKIGGHCKDCIPKIRLANLAKANNATKDLTYLNKWNKTQLGQGIVTEESVKEVFTYMPEGVLIYKDTYHNRAKKGTIAGTSNIGGRSIRINGTNYQAIQLIWIYHGNSASKDLHTYDGDVHNTRISNIREGRRLHTFQQFKDNAKEVHKDRYKYLGEYHGSNKDVTIYCNIHGTFNQRAQTHLNGSGCPACAVKGFNPKLPGILYYLEINNGEAYKIGITNRTVKERFSNKDLTKIKIIREWYFDDGYKLCDTEKLILRKFIAYKYEGAPLLESGNTELLHKNILHRLQSTVMTAI